MARANGDEHWMLRAARRAGVDLPDACELDPATDAPEAWKRVRTVAGIDDDALAHALARVFRTSVADLSAVEPTAVRLLPPSVVRKHLVFPLLDRNRTLTVATCNPSDLQAEHEIGFASGRRPEFVVASPHTTQDATHLAYEPDRLVEDLLDRMGDLDRVSLEVLEEADDTAPIADVDLDSGPAVKLTNMIFHEAISQRASDIHIQPTRTGGAVRFRIDGVLRTALQFPAPVMNRVVSRIKVVGKMDIADRLRPQDGRAQVVDGGNRYDLRISTVPVRGAEKVVVRILDPSSVGTLGETGLAPRDLTVLRGLLRRRDGIVVVTGPTGSGKTTTLYGALTEIATDEVNIMTVEDPVEYELAGLAQIQVETRKGVTFASALRAILRQDPDVIFVGEIRDGETAEIAAQASLTGHLVLATVHANDAVGGIRRLTDLGLEPATVAQSLRGAVAQRLVRRVCPECSVPVEEPLTESERELSDRFGARPTVRAVGCPACQDLGFHGRVPVAEILQMTPTLQSMVIDGAAPAEIEARARQDGMRSLVESALELMAQGVTTIEEVHRVLGQLVEESDDPIEDPDTDSSADEDGGDASSDRRPRVLLVDDDRVSRAVGRALLERDLFRVQEAADGEAALELLAAEPDIDAAVLDLSMPSMDGREVLRRVRADVSSASLPVIILTGAGGDGAETELLAAGADDYITKPIDPLGFAARVQGVLRRAMG